MAAIKAYAASDDGILFLFGRKDKLKYYKKKRQLTTEDRTEMLFSHVHKKESVIVMGFSNQTEYAKDKTLRGIASYLKRPSPQVYSLIIPKC